MTAPIGDALGAPEQRCDKTTEHIAHHWHVDGSPIGPVPDQGRLRMCDGEGRG